MQEVRSILREKSVSVTVREREKKGHMNMCLTTKATCYGVDGPGIESRWEARFSAPVQIGPGAYPASYIMSSGYFPGVKRPGRGIKHPLPTPHVKERVVIPLLPLWAFVACPRVNFTDTLPRQSCSKLQTQTR